MIRFTSIILLRCWTSTAALWPFWPWGDSQHPENVLDEQIINLVSGFKTEIQEKQENFNLSIYISIK